MEEIFRDIVEFEGLYQVSNLGRVKSLGNEKTRKEKILKPKKLNSGYLYVVLCKEGNRKNWLVHRLVAQEFIENPKNFNEVNHKDENKENNSVGNLEWCSRVYNINYGSRNKRAVGNIQKTIKGKRIAKPVRCIETGFVFPSTMDAYRQTGVAQCNISQCCNGKQKTAGKLHWQFL